MGSEIAFAFVMLLAGGGVSAVGGAVVGMICPVPPMAFSSAVSAVFEGVIAAGFAAVAVVAVFATLDVLAAVLAAVLAVVPAAPAPKAPAILAPP